MTGSSEHARLHLPLSAPTLLTSIALVVTGAALLETLLRGVAQPGVAAAFGVTIALGEAIRIALPLGRDSAPLSSTAALAFALSVAVNGQRTTYGAAEVIAVTGLAVLCGMAVQAYAGRHPRPGYLARRVLATGFAAVVFRDWILPGPASGLLDRHTMPASGALLAAVALAALFVDNLLVSVLARLEPGRAPLVDTGPSRRDPVGLTARPRPTARRMLLAFREDCMATAWVCPTVILFAVAIALTARSLGLWVLPIAAAPILVVQRSLRRYAQISATYQQTIRALSRVTELADYTEPGHARRVCHLALAIGRDISLPDTQLLDLEYAALLHDIGQLSLTDPIPGGATVLIARERAASVASLGADVVRQTGVLDRVADILECQWRPFSPQRADEPVLLAAAIIRAANAYDDLVGGALDPDRRLAALRRIRLGMATEYDPRVVESLTRIVESTQPYPG
ncbi:hypothetical protein KGA66_12570 [Actinocrinis puniceicyclus]|uniref:HD domain-containing protein n=1 Tax=Actinocrinis puniceicyclus TaxID=977794 RepID=A0A8J7WPZ2_9ACTN|nr:HD domain-containing phosphohydrolase [Actinocrinis puniceicyclus]MBS2963884.1 hypothetical protein [Actinocrinis puniceicyclus]